MKSRAAAAFALAALGLTGLVGPAEASPPGFARLYDDARKYVDAILEARTRIRGRFAARANRRDRRQKMLIEFILSGKASIGAISDPELEEANGHMRILSKHASSVLKLSRTYVRGDIYEIAWDALRLGKKESKEILEPLLPPESPGDARTSGEEERQGGGR